MDMLSNRQILRRFLYLLSDLIAIGISFSLASIRRFGEVSSLLDVNFIAITAIIISTIYFGGGYASSTAIRAPRFPFKTTFLVWISIIPCTLFIYSLGPTNFAQIFGRGIFPLAILSIGLGSLAARIIINLIIQDSRKTINAVVLGELKSKEHFSDLLKNKFSNLQTTFIPKLRDINPILDGDLLIVTPDHRLSDNERKKIVELRMTGTPVYSLPQFFEQYLQLLPVIEINYEWLLNASGFSMLYKKTNLQLKRAIDLAFSIPLLLTCFPLIVFTAIVVSLTSKGPAFYKQVRVGLNGKKFTIYKIRTMIVDAERGEEIWATDSDPRITRVGRFLRKSRLDELPQLWNIIKGDMSLVGPRPERPNFTSKLSKTVPYYKVRHVVKPGVTGWAQVKYPYGSSAEDALQKLQFDLYYIKNYSIFLDLNILLRTFFVVIRRSGR